MNYYDFVHSVKHDKAACDADLGQGMTLAEHRKVCKAGSPLRCPFEQKERKKDEVDELSPTAQMGSLIQGEEVGEAVSMLRNLIQGMKVVEHENADEAIASLPEDVRLSISHLFTGSAADYERPSLLKVGTGEGKQVYGWGLYASDQRGVAETYVGRYNQARNLLYKGKEIDVGSMVFPRNATPEELALKFGRSTGSVKGAISAMEYEAGKDRTYAKKFREAISWMKNHKDDFKENEHVPTLYEQTFFTNRAPGDESHLLSWYEPVSEENMIRIANAINDADGLFETYKLPSGATSYIFSDKKAFGAKGTFVKKAGEKPNGVDIYEALSVALGSPKAASEFLVRADIDGIKYPVDSYGGKTVKDGDKAGWNYVSFRDDNIRVDHKWKNGMEVPVSPQGGDVRLMIADEDDGKRLTKKEGNRGRGKKIFGWYNRRTGDVHLVKGAATAETVLHELGWHATFQWAEKNAPELHRKMREYADSAPESVKDAVRKTYGGDISPEALLDEIGAERFTQENAEMFEKGVRKNLALRGEERTWWGRVKNGIRATWVRFVDVAKGRIAVKGGTVDTERISRMEPKKGMHELFVAMLHGRSLGMTGLKTATASDDDSLPMFDETATTERELRSYYLL